MPSLLVAALVVALTGLLLTAAALALRKHLRKRRLEATHAAAEARRIEVTLAEFNRVADAEMDELDKADLLELRGRLKNLP
jgi:hypothetical protein